MSAPDPEPEMETQTHPEPEPHAATDPEPETMETQQVNEDKPGSEEETRKGEKEKSSRKEEKRQKRKEKVEEKRELAGTIYPRRHGHIRMENKVGEMFTGQVVQRVTHNGKEVVWIKLHEGNRLQPIQWNKLRGWEYMSAKEAQERKEFLARWEEHERRIGKEPASDRAARELEQRWQRKEERETREQYSNSEQDHNLDRWESMSQPVTRARRRWI